MRARDLTKTELVEILEIIEDAQSCTAPENLRRLLLRGQDLLEAEYSVCGMGILEPGSKKLSEITSVISGNYPREFFDLYVPERMYRDDPIVRYHSRFSLSGFWKDIFKHFDDSRAARVTDIGREIGLVHGLSSSVYMPGNDDEISIISFAGGKDTFTARHKGILDILTAHLNNALVSVSTGKEPATPLPGWSAEPLSLKVKLL